MNMNSFCGLNQHLKQNRAAFQIRWVWPLFERRGKKTEEHAHQLKSTILERKKTVFVERQSGQEQQQEVEDTKKYTRTMSIFLLYNVLASVTMCTVYTYMCTCFPCRSIQYTNETRFILYLIYCIQFAVWRHHFTLYVNLQFVLS